MIGRLRGEVAAKHPPFLLLDVQGVGYELEAPLSTFERLPEVGGQAVLVTHLVVREDAHILYGFSTEAERALFRDLLKISGVGPRMALAILSGMSADQFVRSIQGADEGSLCRLPGIGKKTAQRLIVELRDRLDGFSLGATGPKGTVPMTMQISPETEAQDALVALGYKPADAVRMVKAVAAEGHTSEQIIRAALKAAARNA